MSQLLEQTIKIQIWNEQINSSPNDAADIIIKDDRLILDAHTVGKCFRET
jgi:hypothetical protein